MRQIRYLNSYLPFHKYIQHSYICLPNIHNPKIRLAPVNNKIYFIYTVSNEAAFKFILNLRKKCDYCTLSDRPLLTVNHRTIIIIISDFANYCPLSHAFQLNLM